MGEDRYTLPRNIQGAIQAAKDDGLEVILVGSKSAIENELSIYEETNLPLSIEHASETVTMHESPSSAVRRKRNSSIWAAIQLVKEGKAEAAVSAGNTRAAMAMAKTQLGMLPHVKRPAIAVPLPTPRGFSVLLDAGANVDCKPEHLYQFARR